MRLSSILVLLFASIVVAAGVPTGIVPPPLLRSDAPALEIETFVRPTFQGPYELLDGRRVPRSYTCTVLVHEEPGSRKVWGTRDIVLTPGDSKTASSSLGELTLTFEARIDRNLHTANTRVEITRSGKVIARQKNAVHLDSTMNTER